MAWTSIASGHRPARGQGRRPGAGGRLERGRRRGRTGKWIIDPNHNGRFDPGADRLYTKVDGLAGGRPLVGGWALP
jgi:hypothetical protein